MGAAAGVDANWIRIAAKAEQMKRRATNDRVFLGLPSKFRRWSGFADFAPAHLSIVDQHKELLPFRLNFVQRRVVAAEIRARRARVRPWFIILKYRKGGISTLEQALSYWESWRNQHAECLTLTHDPDATRMIFRMVSRYYDHQPTRHRHAKTEAVVNHMEFRGWDSIYMAATSGKGGNKSRGQTYSRVHCSEAAFYADLAGEHVAMSNAIGPESAYVLESTANGRVNRGQTFHDFWVAAKKGKNYFIPIFLAWHMDPANVRSFDLDELLQTLKEDKEAAELVALHKLSFAQIAWWLEERKKLIADGGSSSKIHQEHPSDDESCFIFSADSYFDAELLVAAERKCVDPLATEDNSRLRIWEVPDEDDPADYSIGADPSGGTGADDCAAVIFNAKTGAQAASYQFDRIAPDEFGLVLAQLGWRWANPRNKVPAYLVIEANNHGHATLSAALKQAKYPKDRVYHEVDEAKVDARGEATPTDRPGWKTTITSLADMAAIVGRMLREASPVLYDRETVKSIRAVGFSPHGAEFTGRDLAVASALAIVGIQYARDSSGFIWVDGVKHEL